MYTNVWSLCSNKTGGFLLLYPLTPIQRELHTGLVGDGANLYDRVR